MDLNFLLNEDGPPEAARNVDQQDVFGTFKPSQGLRHVPAIPEMCPKRSDITFDRTPSLFSESVDTQEDWGRDWPPTLDSDMVDVTEDSKAIRYISPMNLERPFENAQPSQCNILPPLTRLEAPIPTQLGQQHSNRHRYSSTPDRHVHSPIGRLILPTHSRNSSPRRLAAKIPCTREQLHWIRFQKEDCALTYPTMLPLWRRRWPSTGRTTICSLNSALHRDNVTPLYDKHGNLVIADRKLLIVSSKKNEVRARRDNVIPFTLVERHPEEALKYSWVPEEHKQMARRLIAEDETHPNSMSSYRKLMKKWNTALLDKENNRPGRPDNFRQMVTVIEHKNPEVKNACWCKRNDGDSPRGHSPDCPAVPLLIKMNCSCSDLVKSLTLLHMPDCESNPLDKK